MDAAIQGVSEGLSIDEDRSSILNLLVTVEAVDVTAELQ
jgi:hypothetical protein